MNVLTKYLIFNLILCFLPFLVFSQKSEKNVQLRISSYCDSIYNFSSSKVFVTLINNSDSSITISKNPNFDISFNATFEKNGRTIFINPRPLSLQNFDGFGDHNYYVSEILKPGDSKILYLSVLTWGEDHFGKVKVQATYELSRLNPDLNNIETNWITQYVD